jgi:VWFA-related protein
MPSLATTHPAISRLRLLLFAFTLSILLLAADFVRAQNPSSPPPPPPPPSQQNPNQGYRIRRDVDLVVLHATVEDEHGNFVPDLKQESFRVFEDNAEQKISLFKREDIPVTMGLVIDNSGSMREKRARVNAAALTFVQTSNPQDEVFVVNFNDEYYLDLDKDFTNDQKELKEALERIDSRGGTAFFDAVIGSLDHLKKGSRDKKVLLVITDGEDNASRKDLAYTVQAAQQSNAMIYAVGLFADDDKRERRRATKALTALTEATGGKAFFPQNVGEVEAIAAQVAHEVRNQYTIAYYPTNIARDGTFRAVKVELIPPRGRGKMSVRTRPGYFARRASSAD